MLDEATREASRRARRNRLLIRGIAVADPMVDHTSNGTAYLPASQLAAWGRGIALVARTLTPGPA